MSPELLGRSLQDPSSPHTQLRTAGLEIWFPRGNPAHGDENRVCPQCWVSSGAPLPLLQLFCFHLAMLNGTPGRGEEGLVMAMHVVGRRDNGDGSSSGLGYGGLEWSRPVFVGWWGAAGTRGSLTLTTQQSWEVGLPCLVIFKQKVAQRKRDGQRSCWVFHHWSWLARHGSPNFFFCFHF